jgi:hypothetical protein
MLQLYLNQQEMILSVLDALTQTEMLRCEPLSSLCDVNMPQFTRQMTEFSEQNGEV